MYITLRARIADGKYDPGKGRFRDWLKVVARNKWYEVLRRAVRERGRQDLVEPVVPDNVEEFFAREYEEFLYKRALELIKVEFKLSMWQAFIAVTVEGRAPAVVAEELQITVGAVYTAKFRVLGRLKQELKGLLE